MHHNRRRFVGAKTLKPRAELMHRYMRRAVNQGNVSLGSSAAIKEHDDLASITAADKLPRGDFPIGIEWVAGGKSTVIKRLHGHSFGAGVDFGGIHSMPSIGSRRTVNHGGMKTIWPGVVANQ